MKITATASALKALQIISPSNDIRYYLNGIYVEARANETRLVATDGHRLGVVRIRTECNNDVPDGQAVTLIVPNSVIERLRVSRTSPDEVEIGWTDDGRAYVSHDDVRITFTPLEGKFPDYRAVIPAEPSGLASQFNPAYLVDFKKIGTKLLRLSAATRLQVVVLHNGEGASVATIEGCEDFVGVVMPVRSESVRAPSHAWARE
jgi:DNA polymerase-3 subunit beta